jgi:predicted transposase YbfD/YdcC
VPVRLDGKAIRGAKDAEGNQRHLLAALAGPTAQDSVLAAQAEVGPKTNEVPMATQVLGQLDLNGKIVTADALHTVKATAEFIHDNGGEFVLPVKENRPVLFDALDALPWDQSPVTHAETDRGHGRVTTRTMQVLPAPADLPFPHVRQVLLRQRPGRQPAVRSRRARRRQPQPGASQPRRPGPLRPRALGDRVLALASRHPLQGRSVPGQDPVRAKNHGSPAQPGH